MFLVFDIGGTKTRLGRSLDGKSITDVKIFETPKYFDAVLLIIKEYAKDLEGELEAVCCGLPGVFDFEKQILISAPNLPNWVNKPIKKKFEEVLGNKVFLENDASLAGLGESVKGAGKGYSIVAYITLSTGIGGARIVDQRIDKALFGFEPGHQIIDVDGTILGKRTDLEELVGGASMESRFGKAPNDLKNRKIWRELEKYLAAGLVNTILHWSPEILILGGGITQSKNLSIKNLEARMRSFLRVFPELPIIKKGILGDKAGLYGALEYLDQKLS